MWVCVPARPLLHSSVTLPGCNQAGQRLTVAQQPCIICPRRVNRHSPAPPLAGSTGVVMCSSSQCSSAAAAACQGARPAVAARYSAFWLVKGGPRWRLQELPAGSSNMPEQCSTVTCQECAVWSRNARQRSGCLTMCCSAAEQATTRPERAVVQTCHLLACYGVPPVHTMANLVDVCCTPLWPTPMLRLQSPRTHNTFAANLTILPLRAVAVVCRGGTSSSGCQVTSVLVAVLGQVSTLCMCSSNTIRRMCPPCNERPPGQSQAQCLDGCWAVPLADTLQCVWAWGSCCALS